MCNIIKIKIKYHMKNTLILKNKNYKLNNEDPYTVALENYLTHSWYYYAMMNIFVPCKVMFSNYY